MSFIDLEHLQGLEVIKYEDPYLHLVIDDFLPVELAELLSDSFPNQDSSSWYTYDNPLEKKKAQHSYLKMPEIFTNIFNELNGQIVVDYLAQITKQPYLIPDPSLNGGGLHYMPKGHKLDVHLDYSHHVTTGLKRVVNLIVYLNKDWQENWGGELEIWDSTMSKCHRKITPIFNRAVVFYTPLSAHGVPNRVDCPDTQARQSIATYYYVNDSADLTHRQGTRFLARPEDDKSEHMENLRQRRSKGRI